MGEPSEEELRTRANAERIVRHALKYYEPSSEVRVVGEQYLTLLDERARDKAEIARLTGDLARAYQDLSDGIAYRNKARDALGAVNGERLDQAAARATAEIARLRAALESIDAGMPNYEARGMGDPVPADFAVPPSAANAIRRVIRDALNPPATEAKP